MNVIKLYSNTFSPLASLFESEFDSLSYKNKINKIGEASFRVNLSGEKATDTNLQHYNRMEIVESGVVKFTGYIVHKQVNLDTAVIRCEGILGVWGKRVQSGEYTTNGALNAVIQDLIDDTNVDDDTGISGGHLLATNPVNKIFNSATSLAILETLLDSTDTQYEIDKDRKLNIKSKIGEDLSQKVLFQYDIKNTSASNILSFSVDDDGRDIVSRSYGKSNALSSVKEDVGLSSKYGKLDKFRDFRVANSQEDLDSITQIEISPNRFSPKLELSAKIADNFKVGDTVRVKLRNNLITIDDSFQVLEKTVQYIGKQKRISVRVSDLPSDFIDQLGEIKKQLKLLEENV